MKLQNPARKLENGCLFLSNGRTYVVFWDDGARAGWRTPEQCLFVPCVSRVPVAQLMRMATTGSSLGIPHEGAVGIQTPGLQQPMKRPETPRCDIIHAGSRLSCDVPVITLKCTPPRSHPVLYSRPSTGDTMSSKGVPMYRGHKLEDLARMSMDELIQLLPSRRRRTLRRGLPSRQKKLLTKMREARKLLRKGKEVVVKTHSRDMVVLPEMVDLHVAVHNGKEFVRFKILPEMIGHVLGEMAPTCKRVSHGDPGMGATKSSQYVPLK